MPDHRLSESFPMDRVSADGDDTVGAGHLQLHICVAGNCHELSEGGMTEEDVLAPLKGDHLKA